MKSPSTRHPVEYQAWRDMKKRCLKKADPSYKNYGARGITVCASWLNFESFYLDMGPRPSPAHSLDRVDNNGGYCPANCRWATHKVQCNNLRKNKFFEVNGIKDSLAGWAQRLNTTRNALSVRIYNLKWPIEKALTTPVKRKRAA